MPVTRWDPEEDAVLLVKVHEMPVLDATGSQYVLYNPETKWLFTFSAYPGVWNTVSDLVNGAHGNNRSASACYSRARRLLGLDNNNRDERRYQPPTAEGATTRGFQDRRVDGGERSHVRWTRRDNIKLFELHHRYSANPEVFDSKLAWCRWAAKAIGPGRSGGAIETRLFNPDFLAFAEEYARRPVTAVQCAAAAVACVVWALLWVLAGLLAVGLEQGWFFGMRLVMIIYAHLLSPEPISRAQFVVEASPYLIAYVLSSFMSRLITSLVDGLCFVPFLYLSLKCDKLQAFVSGKPAPPPTWRETAVRLRFPEKQLSVRVEFFELFQCGPLTCVAFVLDQLLACLGLTTDLAPCTCFLLRNKVDQPLGNPAARKKRVQKPNGWYFRELVEKAGGWDAIIGRLKAHRTIPSTSADRGLFDVATEAELIERVLYAFKINKDDLMGHAVISAVLFSHGPTALTCEVAMVGGILLHWGCHMRCV